MSLKSSLTPQQLFSEVAKPNIQRSSFRRDHTWSGTFPGDKLIPCFWDEVYPGDTMELKLQALIRYNTLIKPIQAVQYADFHFFFCPMRLVWSNTKKFFGEQTNPGDSIDYLLPQVSAPSTGFPLNSNFDALNAVPLVNGLTVRSDIFRAINLTWNRWYRDQNLQDSLPVPMGDGPDTWTDFTWDNENADYYLPRNKRKDYFTSALPEPQKGPPVTISLGDTAPVITNRETIKISTYDNPTIDQNLIKPSGQNIIGFDGALIDGSQQVQFGTQTGLQTDLSSASLITINALREYNMLQVFLEKDARGGTRFNELNYSHFGVLSPDARVQDPEFLGGHSTDVSVQVIQQTSESATTPQGTLAAMGTIATRGNAFMKSFTEQGVIFGFLSVRTDQMYQQGLNRLWSRRTRHDFYWPTYAHLGEQAILNKEIYAQGPTVTDPDLVPYDDLTFGFQERYGELRYKESTLFGLYRSSAPTSLDVWHLAQDFADLPTLSSEFIEENTPYDRVVAVSSEPDFNGQVYWDYRCTRPMPVRSIPSLMDRL